MSEREMHVADMEVINMTNEATARYRAEAACAAAVVQPIDAGWAAVGQRAHRRVQLGRALSAGARGTVGLVFLGAITRGLIHPVFGLAMAAGCFLWAVHHYRRGYRYG